jgi:hypothetical protein
VEKGFNMWWMNNAMRCVDKGENLRRSSDKGDFNWQEFWRSPRCNLEAFRWLFTTLWADTKLPNTDSWLKTYMNDGALCGTESTLHSYLHFLPAKLGDVKATKMMKIFFRIFLPSRKATMWNGMRLCWLTTAGILKRKIQLHSRENQVEKILNKLNVNIYFLLSYTE